MIASGSTSSPCSVADGADLLAGLLDVEPVERLHRLDAEHDVLGDREDRDQHEVLVDHADAGADRVAGAAELDRLAVDEDLALVRPVEAGEDVHQGGLAGAVLAEQAEDLAGPDLQVHVGIGNDAAEPLGDAPELDVHLGPPATASRSLGGWRGSLKAPAAYRRRGGRSPVRAA